MIIVAIIAAVIIILILSITVSEMYSDYLRTMSRIKQMEMDALTKEEKE